MSADLHNAVSTLHKGDVAAAQALLATILKADPRNELAWYWMAVTQEDPARKHQCLERVLDINPRNEKARHLLGSLDEQRGSEAGVASLEQGKVSPDPTTAPQPYADEGSQLRRIDPLDHEATKKCPFCAESIKTEAVVCRYCGRELTESLVSLPPPPPIPPQSSPRAKGGEKRGIGRNPVFLAAIVIAGACILVCIGAAIIGQLDSTDAPATTSSRSATGAALSCTSMDQLGWIWDRDCRGEILLYAEPKPPSETRVTSRIDMMFPVSYSGETARGDSLITQFLDKCVGDDGKAFYRLDDPGLVDSGLVTSESSGSGAGWIDSYFVAEGERNKPPNACPP